MIYQQKAYEGHAKDHEFSGTSMREHWQSGYEDTKRTLRRKDWLAMPPMAQVSWFTTSIARTITEPLGLYQTRTLLWCTGSRSVIQDPAALGRGLSG
jgi:Patatin phospholipase